MNNREVNSQTSAKQTDTRTHATEQAEENASRRTQTTKAGKGGDVE